MKRALILSALILGAAVPVAAQTPSPMPATAPASVRPIYFGLGGGIELKEGDALRNPSGTHTRFEGFRPRPAGFVSIGKAVGRHVAVEAVAHTEKLSSVEWRWSYNSPYTENRATHRDTVLLGQVRLVEWCKGRACFEPFAGAGFVAHHAVNRVIADCGSGIQFKNPCEPVTPKVGEDEWQWGVAGNVGIAVNFKVSRAVTLGPIAQLSYFQHDDELFRDNFRGPDSGRKWAPFFGVSLTIRP